MSIIDWCNYNNGFLIAVLSFFSLIISITAVAVSIHTARLPFKKKIRLYVNYSINENDQVESVTLTAVNVGNREIAISYLGLVEGKGAQPIMLTEYWIASSPEFQNKTNLIIPGEKYEYRISLSIYQELLCKVNNFKRVFVCAKDSEGKRYFQKIQLEQL